MIIAPEKRKEIQKILEEFIKKRPSSVELADIKFALVILSFIHELNEQDTAMTINERGIECPSNDGVCIWKYVKELQNIFSTMEIPEVFDESYLNSFALLAQNITRLSGSVNTLSELLHRRYAEKFPRDIQAKPIVQ